MSAHSKLSIDSLGSVKCDYITDGGFPAAEFGMQYYRPADLDMFFRQFAPDRVGQQPKLISIAGGQ